MEGRPLPPACTEAPWGLQVESARARLEEEAREAMPTVEVLPDYQATPRAGKSKKKEQVESSPDPSCVHVVEDKMRQMMAMALTTCFQRQQTIGQQIESTSESAKKRIEEARALLEQSLQLNREEFGVASDEVVHTLRQIIQLVTMEADYGAAEVALQRIHDIEESHLLKELHQKLLEAQREVGALQVRQEAEAASKSVLVGTMELVEAEVQREAKEAFQAAEVTVVLAAQPEDLEGLQELVLTQVAAALGFKVQVTFGLEMSFDEELKWVLNASWPRMIHREMRQKILAALDAIRGNTLAGFECLECSFSRVEPPNDGSWVRQEAPEAPQAAEKGVGLVFDEDQLDAASIIEAVVTSSGVARSYATERARDTVTTAMGSIVQAAVQWVIVRTAELSRALKAPWAEQDSTRLGHAEVQQQRKMLQAMGRSMQHNIQELTQWADADPVLTLTDNEERFDLANETKEMNKLIAWARCIRTALQDVVHAIQTLLDTAQRQQDPEMNAVAETPNHQYIGVGPEVESSLLELTKEKEASLIVVQEEVVITLQKIASVHIKLWFSQGKNPRSLDEACAGLERALRLQEIVVGANHPTLIATLQALASVLEKLNRMDRGKLLMKRAAAIEKAAKKWKEKTLNSPRIS